MQPLSTKDILKEIDRDMYAKRHFIGVYPCNHLPVVNNYPASLILNTDPDWKPGEHWLAIYFNEIKEAEFFDSYGFSACHHKFEKYIKLFSTSYKNNSTQIQSYDSNACGYYCLYFIMLKSRGFTLSEINSLFSKTDFKINDYLVSHIVN